MGPLEAFAHELMRRELEAPRATGWTSRLAPPKPETKPIDPEVAALIGLATDAVGTYMTLHRGNGTEGNPVYAHLFRQDPLKTSLGVAAGGLGMMALRNVLRSKGGRTGGFWAGLADALAGQQGADQTIAGIQHLERLDVPYPGAVQRYIDPRGGETRRMERVREAVAGVRKR